MMKFTHYFLTVAIAASVFWLMSERGEAQTVLSGDHVIEGNLEVGTVTQRGGITISGETGNAASPGIKVTGDGGVLFEGTGVNGAIPREGGGPRMMWYPGKAAFRVGADTWGYWDDEFTGFSSVAFGNSLAFGSYSTAMGNGGAEGSYSTAMGGGGAYGNYSTAISYGYATGSASTAMSEGLAYGSYSTGMSGGVADGEFAMAASGGHAGAGYSTAMSGGYVLGDYSVSMSRGQSFGNNATAMSGGSAEGDWATAIGRGISQGVNAVSVGEGAVASCFRSIVVGSYNKFRNNESSESVTEWIESDELFVVGNGTGNVNDAPHIRFRDALVIRKNGDCTINGNIEVTARVKMPRQGDILMGEFGEP